jgi:hypothetical protein
VSVRLQDVHGYTDSSERSVDSSSDELGEQICDSRDLFSYLFGQHIRAHDARETIDILMHAGLVDVKDGTSSVTPDVALKEAENNMVDYQERGDITETENVDTLRWTFGTPEKEMSATGSAALLNLISVASFTAAFQLGIIDCPETGPFDPPFIRFTAMHDNLPLSGARNEHGCRPDLICLTSDCFHSEGAVGPNGPLMLRREDPSLNAFAVIQSHYPNLLRFCQGSDTGPAGSFDARASAFNLWWSNQVERDFVDRARLCWPALLHVGEVKNSIRYKAIREELVYMRLQRRSQPWLQSVIGIIATSDDIGILRADPLGVEQCLVNRSSSRGAMESIRMCLGLVLMSNVERGRHPCMILKDTETPNPNFQNPACFKSASLPSGSSRPLKRKSSSDLGGSVAPSRPSPSHSPHIHSPAAADDVGAALPEPCTAPTMANRSPKLGAAFTPSSPAVVPHFIHPRIRFIELPTTDMHFPPRSEKCDAPDKTRYYVHHIINDRGSLVGRSARIFCVSREVDVNVDPEDPDAKFVDLFADTPADSKTYVGAYALKLYYASHETECFEEDLITTIRNAQIKHVLVPSM